MRVKPGGDVVAGGIIQEVEQDVFIRLAGQPEVGGGIVLPEGTPVLGLPALDGFGRGFVAGIGSQVVCDRPATHTGTVRFKAVTAQQFAGREAIGARGFGREQFWEQLGDFRRPRPVMSSARGAGGPGVGSALRTGPQIIAVKFVKAGTGHVQFLGGGQGRNLFRPITG